MCIICKNKKLKGLKILDCSNCPLLTSIPQIEGLQTLYCCNCPLLTTIPQIKGLQILDCWNCSFLTTVPQIEALQVLNCSNCPMLTTVPQIEGLIVICFDCKWLKTDIYFNESITKLKIIQSWFKKILLSKRLMKLIPQLIPLYYHPDAKGG